MKLRSRLYIGDNVKILRRIVLDNSIQLTVTSPPYDNLRKYNGYAWDFEAVAHELYRVTKPGGVVVWVVADATVNGNETGTSFHQALYFKDIGFNLHDTMIYEKTGTGACGSNLAYWQIFEYMFVFAKGNPTRTNLIKDTANIKFGSIQTRGRVAVDGTVKDTKRRIVPKFSIRTNVWRIQQGNNGDDKVTHPAKFPEKLADGHIKTWSNPGDICFRPICRFWHSWKNGRT